MFPAPDASTVSDTFSASIKTCALPRKGSYYTPPTVTQPYLDTDPLFKSKKGVKALSVPSVNRLVKGWCREINLKGNYGSHTLRKTFGYMQRTLLNTSVAELMVMFNHSSQRQTLDYLCIQPEEIKNAYMQLKL